jgi:hypothetical protein
MLQIFFLFPSIVLLSNLINIDHPRPTPGRNNFKIPSDHEKNIVFSGYKWKVRNTMTAQGPGPNYFSKQSVWVDKKGNLHLYVHKDSTNGNWICAEITSEKSFQYGTYSFEVEGAIDKLDKNIVLGLFNYSGNDGYDEMDIEFGRWGNASYPNLNYTVWPAEKGFKNSSYTKEYEQDNKFSIQQFKRTKNRVVFATYKGRTITRNNLMATYSCVQPPTSLSILPMPIHINLWLFDGNPPADNKSVEIIINNFEFRN